MTATWCIDKQWDAVHIFFDSIPPKEIRDEMKSLRFKWHKRDKYWFARKTPERIKLAEKICGKSEAKTKEPKQKIEERTEKKNKFGVQVGDIFSCSWGYDQTQVDFFQVLKLCGEKSVRVRHVQPKLVSENAESGMSAKRTYRITREILPEVERSIFVNDQEKGDLKRLKSWSKDGKSDPIFEMGSGGYICHLEPLGDNEHFESWWR